MNLYKIAAESQTKGIPDQTKSDILKTFIGILAGLGMNELLERSGIMSEPIDETDKLKKALLFGAGGGLAGYNWDALTKLLKGSGQNPETSPALSAPASPGALKV